jgi:hypothetical protein
MRRRSHLRHLSMHLRSIQLERSFPTVVGQIDATLADVLPVADALTSAEQVNTEPLDAQSYPPSRFARSQRLPPRPRRGSATARRDLQQALWPTQRRRSVVKIVVVPFGLRRRIVVCAAGHRNRENGEHNDCAESSLDSLAHGAGPFRVRKVTSAQADAIPARFDKSIRASRTMSGAPRPLSLSGGHWGARPGLTAPSGRWRVSSSARQPAASAIPTRNYVRQYWWCRPPRMVTGTIRPIRWTGRWTGASLFSDRWVRSSL